MSENGIRSCLVAIVVGLLFWILVGVGCSRAVQAQPNDIPAMPNITNIRAIDQRVWMDVYDDATMTVQVGTIKYWPGNHTWHYVGINDGDHVEYEVLADYQRRIDVFIALAQGRSMCSRVPFPQMDEGLMMGIEEMEAAAWNAMADLGHTCTFVFVPIVK